MLNPFVEKVRNTFMYQDGKVFYKDSGAEARVIIQGNKMRMVLWNGKHYPRQLLVWVLHHDIMVPLKYINGDKADDRIENLDVWNPQPEYDNSENETKGVYYCTRRKRWIAQLFMHGKRHYISQHRDPGAAIRAHKEYVQNNLTLQETLEYVSKDKQGDIPLSVDRTPLV